MKSKKHFIFFRYFVLIIIMIGTLLPIIWMFTSSLKPAEDLFSENPSLLPRRITFEWYENLLLKGKFSRYFLNSTIVALGTTFISVFVTTLGSFSLTRFHFRSEKPIMFSILLSYIFPPILLMLPLYGILSSYHLLDTYTGLIFSHTIIVIPFSLWVLRSYFESVPYELDEAAMMDGLSRWGTFWRIVVPLASPGILSVALFSFIMSWNEYLFASIFLPGPNYKTLPIGITEFIAPYDVRWGEIMAASVVTSLPVLLIFVVMQKYFIQGLTSGAIKG